MDCAICAKHRGEGDLAGPVVWRDDLVVVSHHPKGFPGYLFVETVRHVPYFDELNSDEAAAVARAAWAAARVLRAELAPLFVFSCVVGRAVAHFHQHVFVRHAGTPEEHDWTWSEAPIVPAREIEELCARLRARMTDVMAARDGWNPCRSGAASVGGHGAQPLSSAIGKTGARTRAEAVRLAEDSGWL